MSKKTIRDIPLEGRKLLMRVDFNVPISDIGEISNDRRIRASLSTIRMAVDAGAAVILMSHLGRPSGDPERDRRFALDGVAVRLAELLGRPVPKADQVIGPDVARMAGSLNPGDLLLLENLRFHPGEKSGDEQFAAELAALAELYVNDALGTCHRKDASMVAVPKRFPAGCRVAGLLLERELEVLDQLRGAPAEPMVAVLGGAKISDKITLIESLLPKLSRLLIGGAMSYTFLRAAGMEVGRSLVETDRLDVARHLADLAGNKLCLPTDHRIAMASDRSAPTQVITGPFPPDWVGVDIGPDTIARYQREIDGAKTVVWNGPVGKFEIEPFSDGSRAIAEAMARSSAVTVVGGGETAELLEQYDLADRMTHVSTGGGAFLAYLGGEQFESLAVLDDSDGSG